MQIILLERIEKLGSIGDVVTVKDGYARNFLLPNKKALRANEANRKVFEANRERLESENAERRTEAEKAGGKVAKTETWGLKNLAYKIDRNRKAHFVLLNLEGPGAMVAELERQNRINEDVIRWLTVSVDEHESGPSAQMRKNERDRKRRAEREERD